MPSAHVPSPKVRVFAAIACVGLAVTLVEPLTAGAATPSVAPLSVVFRTSKNFHYSEPWEARCGSDFCELPEIVRFTIETPTDADQVDVDVSLSLNFKVSSGDKIQVAAGYSRDGGQSVRFSPGSYPLTSPSPDLRTSTTLTWNAKGLDALGARYVIEIGINPRHGRGGRNVRASGTRAAVTVTEES
jgi:hypothetical protein